MMLRRLAARAPIQTFLNAAKPWRCSLALLLSLQAMPGGRAETNPISLESLGVRGGFSATSINDNFYQAEVFSTLNLPWGWDWGPEWRLQMGLDTSAGMLSRRGDHGFIATFGPTARLKWRRLPIEAVAGCNPTILSRDEYENIDFGIPLQFTSHFGFVFNLTRHSTCGYRFQHMSNAGFGDGDNPGLNLHLFSVGYRF